MKGPPKKVGVGVLGCGTVGSALIGTITKRQQEIADRTGIELEIKRIAVRDLHKTRSPSLASDLYTDDAREVVADDGVDIVVELMGGIEDTKPLVAAALEARKPVVTANKEMMAAVGAELNALAAEKGVDLLYEASVAGGIPLIRPLRESLAGESISRVMGIVNGTTNYILTRMTESRVTYETALAEAQEQGFAEADPTADVEAFDAAAKAAIIANVAFGAAAHSSDVQREGITKTTLEDIDLATNLGYVIKPLAVVHRNMDGEVGIRTHPAMVPKGHPLASVRLSFNALFVEGDDVGELMLYGRGAGGPPTASAVLGDLIDAAYNRASNVSGPAVRQGSAGLSDPAAHTSAFYIEMSVTDKPGSLAKVAEVFAAHTVSIRSMEQIGLGQQARLVFVTHAAVERDVVATLDALRHLDNVQRTGNVIRVMEES